MSASSPARTALIAGHSQGEAQLVRGLLRRLGVQEVRTAADGAEAVAAMTSRPPDLLVLDWNIRSTPADMVVKAAREKREAGPRILLTMEAPTRGMLAAAVDLAVDSVVAKPFSPSAFMDRVPGRFVRKEAGREARVT